MVTPEEASHRSCSASSSASSSSAPAVSPPAECTAGGRFCARSEGPVSYTHLRAHETSAHL
eukprot:148559-Alexandrium_andersonii.AAC.1